MRLITTTGQAFLDRLHALLVDIDPARPASERLGTLIEAGLDRLPLPGSGATLTRWRALAAVAASDLSLAKLYEGHTDALAILAEFGVAPVSSARSASWGVWAAESPQGRAVIERQSHESALDVQLSGAKCWCSGAAGASHALLTAWHADGSGPQLVSLDLRQPGLRVCDQGWQAIGMAGSASLDVEFDRMKARLVGPVGVYLTRAGFWQGGAGVAACWYGGALALARALRNAVLKDARLTGNAFRLAALGRVDVSLQSLAALLREGAAWIDANPRADARAVACRVRLAAEQSATLVLAEVGRALGATPFCRDAAFARAAADLPVFIRQSHAERDLAALGGLTLQQDGDPWGL